MTELDIDALDHHIRWSIAEFGAQHGDELCLDLIAELRATRADAHMLGLAYDAACQERVDLVNAVALLQARAESAEALVRTYYNNQARAERAEARVAEADGFTTEAAQRALRAEAKLARIEETVSGWRHRPQCESGPFCCCGIAKIKEELRGDDV